jgi:hypothetical protein
LGAPTIVKKSAFTGNAASVTLNNMTNNLVLNGANNSIEVDSGGELRLWQAITTAGTQNTMGGIALGAGRIGNVAVNLVGGTLDRSSLATQGIPDQVLVGGAIYNSGGTVQLADGNMLKVTGKDANSISYWQQASTGASLTLGNGANINAVGSYLIDAGLVQLTAPSGGRSDALDGTGLTFSGANAANLTFVDSTAGTPGTITVQGPVTLAANTTTTMNFNGTNNTADLLDVQNGALKLNGTLSLKGNVKPTAPLNFLDDSGPSPSITGAFTTITDTVNDKDTGQVVVNNPQLEYYQVTIK